MRLPFTRDQFFDVFASYNEAFWPVAVALWIMTALAVAVFAAIRQPEGRFITLVMMCHWAWAGLAYHARFFSRINPAAWLFCGMFLIQAGLLAWYGLVQERLQYSHGRSLRHMLSSVLLGYGLAYPVFIWAEGHTFPRMPSFGVPCPTTIVTIGFLLAVEGRVPVMLSVIPILWSFIGGSAVFQLGVRSDFMLLVAGISLLIQIGHTRPRLSQIARTSIRHR